MELPKDEQTGEISFYKTRDRGEVFPENKRFGFIIWPGHDNIHYSFRNNRKFLEGKESADVEHRQVRFYACEGIDKNHPTAEITAILGGYSTAKMTSKVAGALADSDSLSGVSASLKFDVNSVNFSEINTTVWVTLKQGKKLLQGVIVNLVAGEMVQVHPEKDATPTDTGQVHYDIALEAYPTDPIPFTIIVMDGPRSRSITYLYQIVREDDRVEFKKITADSKRGDADMAERKSQPAIRFRVVKLTDAGLVVRVLAEQGISPYKGEVLFFLNEEPATGLVENIDNNGFAEHTFGTAELPKAETATVRVQIKGTTVSQESTPVALTGKASDGAAQPEIFEVVGRPIGDNQWDINFGVIGPENKPLKDIPVRFEYGSKPLIVKTTDQMGEASEIVEVDEDTWGSAWVNSALNQYNIPLAGKEEVIAPAVSAPPSLWKKINNWVFLAATLIFVALILSATLITVWWVYNWLTTPYQSPVVVSSPAQPDGPWMPTAPSPSPQAQPEQSGGVVSWFSWGLQLLFSPLFWLIVFGWAVFWLILIPLCFYDEIEVAIETVWHKTTEGMHKVQFKRKPFRLRTEVRRTPEGLSTSQFFNGQKVEGSLAELFAKSKKGFKQLSWGQLIKLVLGLDFAAELLQFIIKRLLGR